MHLIRYTIFLFCFTCLSSVYGQTTSIPDTAFEQKLINLNIDSDGLVNGLLLNSDANPITTLDISGPSFFNLGNIQSIKGIEAFVNLQVLNCRNNKIDSLDFSSNFNLRSVYCDYNQIKFVNVSNCPLLDELLCWSNQIDSLDLSNNLNLTELNLTGNQVSLLDLSNNYNLSNLGINSNQLTQLDLSNNPTLTELYCENNQFSSLDLSSNSNLHTLACANNQLSYINFKNSNNSNVIFFNAQLNQSGLLICVDDSTYAVGAGWLSDAGVVYTDTCNRFHGLQGLITHDSNINCAVDSGETLLPQHIVRIIHAGDTSYTSSDLQGFYSKDITIGNYQLEVLPKAPYWSACPNIQSTTINNNSTIDTVNWPLQAIDSCSYLVVSIGAPFLRMTNGGSYYVVNYCNQGTVLAQNAYVEVAVDSFLNILGSTIPITNQVGNHLTFNLGNIGIGQCGSFRINIEVNSNAIIHQTHCTEAHIYPDSICNATWNGPIIEASANCQNDTVIFRLRNTGSNIITPQTYSIFEDDVLLNSGPINLGGGIFIDIIQPAAAGKTYRIEATQATGFPLIIGPIIAHASIEGCKPSLGGGFGTGFIPQYYTGNSSPFIAVDCQSNISAYDPNDKAAQPEGFDVAHYIYKNIPLEYRVRFQNTGSDTAFNIVIVDTLSPYVDISSLSMGASSHDYIWSISGAGILTVTFNNVLLVDSNSNEALSHGFFTYNIQQQPNLPNGTIINNQAAIYFDFNPPIFTNTTFHTIGENFILLQTGQIFHELADVKIFPNPFETSTTILVNGLSYEQLDLEIYDVAGRTVQEVHQNQSNQIDLHRGSMQQGIYFYRLKADGALIHVGKIIVR